MTPARIETTRFGSIVPEEIYELPEGIPGLEGRAFALIPDPHASYAVWLQSLRDPASALLLVDPDLLTLDYSAQAKPAELRAILADGEDPSTLRRRVVVRAGDEAGELVFNLFAPLYFHPTRHLALQIPLVGSGYSVREPWPPRPATPEPEEE